MARAFTPTWWEHSTGYDIKGEVPDGVPCMCRVETHAVHCAGGDAAYRPGLVCCSVWRQEQDVGSPCITIAELRTRLRNADWRQLKSELWVCPECAAFARKKKRLL